jgi:hypothetical protein
LAVTVPDTGEVPERETVPETGCVTALPSTLSATMEAMPWMVRTSVDADPAVPKAGCLALVEAPVGRGRAAAETARVPVPALAVTVPETVTVPDTPTVPLTGWVTADPSTFRAVMPASPCTEMTSADGVPAVPKAGCLADVAAPVGKTED